MLIEAGYLDAATPVLPCAERLWLVRDTGSGFGRVAWRSPFPAVLTNWGLVWRALRERVPDASYRAASTVTAIHPDRDGATVVTAGNPEARFELVVGADGYRSETRPLVDPQAKPSYAGYSLFRGTYPEHRLPAPVPAELDTNATTVCFPYGHAVFYLIPDFDGGRRINWAIYHAIPGVERFRDPTSVPPGAVGTELLAQLDTVLSHFPDYWAGVVRDTERAELSLQPVYDATVAGYAAGRLLLAGDAGAVARPHTGSGATKALQDAITLGRLAAEHGSWADALAAYDTERRQAGNALVALGQRLGAAQVENAPAWHSMSPNDFEDWMSGAVAGQDIPYKP